MKFTELLAEYQVPEWKSQYVDYKWGKKLLKKIPDDLKDRLKRHSTFNGELDVPTGPQDISAQEQAVHVDQVAEESVSPKTVGMTPGALLGEPSETEPINSGSENNDNYGATESREGSVDSGKGSDPQQGTGTGTNLSSSYMSRERLSRGQLDHPTPILLSKISTSGGDSVKLPPAALDGGMTPEMAPHRGIVTRGKSSSGKSDSVKAKFHIGTPKITPEANTNYPIMDRSFAVIPPYDSEKDFIAWLDSQLDKVNEFYDQKMNETHERYRILVGQLVRLQRQKLHLRQKPNKPAREGLSVVERQIELPSLPSFGWLRRSDSNEACDLDVENTRASSESALHGQNPHYHDATTDHEGISYASARRQLKTAMQEYYRSIELLRSYCTLNRTAFRKILKKYDKIGGRHMSPYYMDLVDHTEFCNVENSRLDIVAAKVEDLYTNNFERGNRKHAISKLRSAGVNKSYYFATFRGGIFFGLAIPFFIEGLYRGCMNLVEHKSPDTAYLLQIWAGFFLILLFLLLFPLCCLVWNKFKINYTFIFEFSQDHLDYRQFFEMPAFYFFFMSIFAWLTFYSFWESSFRSVYYPCIFLIFAVVTFFLPVGIFYWSARQWLIRALSRILLSGLYPVEFRDFFLGDIICSMTYSMSNIALFFCLYSHEWSEGFHGIYNPSHCGSSHNRLMGFFNALPGIFRWLQCLRRFADTGDAFPHLANMTKYSLTIMYYVAQSVWRMDTTTGNRAFFIFFATVNSTYCYIWDIMMDWSLLEFGSKNFLLRNQLTYKVKWPYYSAMVIDLVLRFNWIWYAIFEQQIQQKQLLSFFVALSEIFRRVMWMFFRMENEHVSNVKRFRASRDVPLPYHVHVCAEPCETDETAVEQGSNEDDDDEEEARDRMGSSTGVEWARDSPGVVRDSPRKSRLTESPLRKRNSHVEEGNTPSLKATATPVMEAISNMVQKAHTADFQRRKQPRDNQDKDSDGEDDDDDEDDDSS
ncbi:Protein SYG1-like protein [Yarrowia sp. C11]|nr:Protein SYG1-like protein [Yarrowia sp. C11]KAG5364476.1 Protein SYG1-like protein [Yarrowia sp. E02]